MIFQENRLLADDSHEISYIIFFQKLGKRSQNLSSAAVVIGALRVKRLTLAYNYYCKSITYFLHLLVPTVTSRKSSSASTNCQRDKS